MPVGSRVYLMPLSQLSISNERFIRNNDLKKIYGRERPWSILRYCPSISTRNRGSKQQKSGSIIRGQTFIPVCPEYKAGIVTGGCSGKNQLYYCVHTNNIT